MSPSAVELPPMLVLAGCRLVESGRQLVVLDPHDQELEHAGRGRREWLCAVCEQLMIERLAGGLGLKHELHGHHLQMRLWWPGEDPEVAPWRSFAEALRWLVEEAPRELDARQAVQKHPVVSPPLAPRAHLTWFALRGRTRGKRKQRQVIPSAEFLAPLLRRPRAPPPEATSTPLDQMQAKV